LERLLAHKEMISSLEPAGRGKRRSTRELEASYERPENYAEQSELLQGNPSRF
jgi:hypothetical protein